jgi:hypothetical protein
MNIHPKIPNLIVGGMLIVSGAFGYFWGRSHREAIRGLSYKQFVSCMVAMMVCGTLTGVVQFFISE